MERLRKHFPETCESIYALSLIRIIDPVSLESAKERWEKLHISTFMDAHLSPNTLTDLLHQIGSDMASQYSFFQELMSDSKKLAFDLSSIFSDPSNHRTGTLWEYYHRRDIRIACENRFCRR